MSIKITGNVGFDRSVFKFFDTLDKRYDKERMEVLNKAGKVVRGIARRSIRKRAWKAAANRRGRPAKHGTYTTYWGGTTSISPAGSAPRSHTSGSTFGIKSILYGYDSKTDQVIVGPVGGNRSRNSVPQVLEFGGQTVTNIPAYAIAKKRAVGIYTKRKHRMRKTIKARPYMGPALKIFTKDYPKLFRDTLV